MKKIKASNLIGKIVAFPIMTNSTRKIYRRMIKEQQEKREQAKKAVNENG